MSEVHYKCNSTDVQRDEWIYTRMKAEGPEYKKFEKTENVPGVGEVWKEVFKMEYNAV